MSGLRYGYGTNGLADHRLPDALALLADTGYDGVALTLDHQHLDPYAPDLADQVTRLRRTLDRLGLAVVIETGARYLLDPRRKHEPTLLSDEGRTRRLGLLRRAIALGGELGAEAVSFWSGVRAPEIPEQEAWRRLADGCAVLLDEAERAGVRLAFEPEPGMLVDTIGAYERLVARLDGRDLWLTLDIGHCRCVEPEPVAACVRRGASRLVNVQIDDMRRGVHEHLELGTGEVDFGAALDALQDVGYRGLVSVELPRHSHAAPRLVEQSLGFLRSAEQLEMTR